MITLEEKQELEKQSILERGKKIAPGIAKKLNQAFSKEGWVNFVFPLNWDGVSVELTYSYTYSPPGQNRKEMRSSDGKYVYYMSTPRYTDYKSWLIPIERVQLGNEEEIVSWLQKSYPRPFFD